MGSMGSKDRTDSGLYRLSWTPQVLWPLLTLESTTCMSNRPQCSTWSPDLWLSTDLQVLQYRFHRLQGLQDL